MERSYTVKQVSDILGYSTNSIYTFLKESRIKGVRIGKGRFRIPQEELDKLLHLKKTSISVPQPNIVTPLVSERSEVIPSLEYHLDVIKENQPSLFDWFISLTSVIVGFTMILFVRNFEEFSTTSLSQFFTPIKINLLAAGVGLFSINFFRQARKKWYFVFYLIILFDFLIYGLILYLGKDFLGSFFYSLSSVVIIFHLILNLKGITSFKIFLSFLTICSPLFLVLFPNIVNFNELMILTGLKIGYILTLWLVVVCLINTIIWLHQNNRSPIYWASVFIASLGLGYFAYLYSGQLYWSRTLIFILVILFLAISSFWDEINHKYRDNYRVMINIFADISLIFVTLISVIWVIQNNVKTFAQVELVNKLANGQNYVSLSVKSAQEKLESLSKNKLLIESISKKDKPVIEELLKGIFIYSENFHRIMIADKIGDVQEIYPIVEIPNTNVSSREYFQVVSENKVSYLSNLYQTEVDGEKRYVISINVPIIDDKGNFLGMIIGSLDIDSMKNKLDRIANINDSEYFIVIDDLGNLIIGPNDSNLLSDDEIMQIKNSEDSNNKTAGEILNLDNGMLQVHDYVEGTNWDIAIRRPLLNTYNFDNKTNIFLCISIIISGLMIIILNVIHVDT